MSGFDRLTAGQGAPGANSGNPSDGPGGRASGEFLRVLPPDMPPPPKKTFKGAVPSRVWPYKDESGRTFMYVWRIDKPLEPGDLKPGKDVIPLTAWREAGGLKWRFKGAPAPRPLYGLDRLAARPDSAVLVVEGEKAADAAATLFPDLVAVTWCGGGSANDKVDWSPLAGRRMAILPDADKKGLEAARAVRGALVGLGVKAAGVIYLPEGLPNAWDVADDFPDDFTTGDLRGMIDKALAGDDDQVVAADSEGWPAGFEMNGRGLWLQPRKEDEKPRWICGPFEVLGEARDQEGNGWSVVLKFRDRDGREKTAICSKGSLSTTSTELRKTLSNLGLEMPRFAQNSGDPLADCLLKVRVRQRVTLVNSTGWSKNAFVLPTEVIAVASAEPHMFTGDARSLHFGKAGTLDGWRNGVATMAAGNSRAVLAISLALAGPLLERLGRESGGVHLWGKSSSGKSTVAMAAGSVWGGGGPLGFSQSWRSTDNGLENVAASHADAFLSMDELGQLSPEVAGNCVYMLANGKAKIRKHPEGQMRPPSEWRLLFLSTGEHSVPDHIRRAKGGGDVKAGQEVRVIDIPADAGRGLRCWDDIHTWDNGAQFTEAVKVASREHYGHAGPAFVRAILEQGDAVLDQVRETEQRFRDRALWEADSPQISRVAARFGLIAGAGEAAISLGLLPWEKGHAFGMALYLFQDWAESFGRTMLREDSAVLRRLVELIPANGSRFATAADDDEWIDEAVDGTRDKPVSGRAGESRSLTTWGVLHRAEGEDFYLFHSGGWKEVFKDMDGASAATFLKDAGYLVAEPKRLQKRKKFKGVSVLMYWVRAKILEHDFGANG